MKNIFLSLIALVLAACVVMPAPQWAPITTATEDEYVSYMKPGTATVSGQAFMRQQGGGTVKAAGRQVSLDPATTTGRDFWKRLSWVHRFKTPESPGFQKTRRITTADAEGRFSFKNLPAGQYYLLTEVNWVAGKYSLEQGGLVGKLVDVQDGQTSEIIATEFTP